MRSQKLEKMGKTEAYKVPVDYSLDVYEAIEAGKYGKVDDEIVSEVLELDGPIGHIGNNAIKLTSEGYHLEGCHPKKHYRVRRVLIHLVHLGREATTLEVLSELSRRNLRPATLRELLALGAAQPVLQREFYVVALGSGYWFSDDPDSFVGPVLTPLGVAVEHEFGKTRYNDGRWSSAYRFAAVRK